MESFSPGKSLLALLVALLLQIGVNFANDYSDGVRGTDRERLGPTRLTASGLVPSRRVLLIALGCFGLAALLGLILVAWAATWWFLAVGAAAILAAWFYTGGKNPYGYAGVGLSEIFVFVFFGLVATVGTTWVQAYSAPVWLWFAASGMGLISIALLMVNNLRDIPTDRLVGKITVAVRLGDRGSRTVYVGAVALAAGLGVVAAALSGLGFFLTLWLAVALFAFGVATVLPVMVGATGKGLLRTLRNTGLFGLVYALLLGLLFAV